MVSTASFAVFIFELEYRNGISLFYFKLSCKVEISDSFAISEKML